MIFLAAIVSLPFMIAFFSLFNSYISHTYAEGFHKKINDEMIYVQKERAH